VSERGQRIEHVNFRQGPRLKAEGLEAAMERHLDVELTDLKKKLLLMGGSVESQLQDVLQALTERDSNLAIRVVENDLRINELDLEIDETCLRMLALYHPRAGDLRYITTAMKISRELERMSDMAENIAERAIELNEEPQLKPYIDIPRMAELTSQMVKECLDAFVNCDVELARKVCRDDPFVDDLTEQLFRELVSFMLEDPITITRAVRLTFIGKYYERIADHATNIAELVVYMVEGKIIRHLTAGG
jgi:phosphate transport system protein